VFGLRVSTDTFAIGFTVHWTFLPPVRYISPILVAIRVVRLGSPRSKDEGLRIGTVRRPPRGVPKTKFASQNWYDVWFPNLAPSLETMKLGLAAETPAQWAKFVKKYRAEMASPENSRTIDLLAALSRHSNFSIGCYCEDESHCHRSVLRQLLADRGALFVPSA
jgi:uncharacterized protein YeaO (DUF488 family)